MAKEITTADKGGKLVAIAEQLQACSEELQTQMADMGANMVRALTYAQTRNEVKQMLTGELFNMYKSLAGTVSGFEMDAGPGGTKDNPKPYSDTVIQEALVEACLQGLQPVGAEFGIIQGKMYIKANGYENRFKRMPGITNVECEAVCSGISGGKATVNVRLHWKKDGADDCLRSTENGQSVEWRKYEVMANTIDAAIPKGTRRAYRDAEKQAGCDWLVSGDSDEPDADTPQIVKKSTSAKAIEAMEEKKS